MRVIVVPKTSGGSPLNLPLVNSGSPIFTYLGSFNGPSDGSFQYGGGALSVGGHSVGVLGHLYASGIQQGNNDLGKMSIPSPTGGGGTYAGSETATTLVSGTTSVALGALGGSSQTSVTGSLEYGGKLYCTGAIDYDASGNQNAFMVIGTTSIASFGSACHSSGDSGTSINRMFSNGMGVLPAAWQTVLGKPAFIFGGPGGGAGLSIISQQACGYGFSTFDPAVVTSGGAVALTEYVNYPFNSGAGSGSEPISALSGYSTYTQANWSGFVADNLISTYDYPVGCAFIAPGSRSLLFLHMHTYGPSGGAGSDPCNNSASGSNNAPLSPDTVGYIRVQIAAYDMATLVSNKLASGSPTAPKPYAWWTFPSWQTYWGSAGACPTTFDSARETQAWATFDQFNNLLYASMGWPAANGTIYVFKVNSL